MAAPRSFVHFTLVLCCFSSLAQLRSEGRSIVNDFAPSRNGYEVSEDPSNAAGYGSGLLLRSKRQTEQEPVKLQNPFEVDPTTGEGKNRSGGIVTAAPEGQSSDGQRASPSLFLDTQSQAREASQLLLVENRQNRAGPGSRTGAPEGEPAAGQRASPSPLSEGQSQTRETTQVLLTQNGNQNKIALDSMTGAVQGQLANVLPASPNQVLDGQSQAQETSQVLLTQNSNQDKLPLGSTTGILGGQPANLQPSSPNQDLEGQGHTQEASQVSEIQNSSQDKVAPGSTTAAVGEQPADVKNTIIKRILDEQSQTRDTSQVLFHQNSNQNKIPQGSITGALEGQPTNLQPASLKNTLEGKVQKQETSQVSGIENSSQNKVALGSITASVGGQPADVQTTSINPLLDGQSQTRETSQILLIQNSNTAKVRQGSTAAAPEAQAAGVQNSISNPFLEGQSQTSEKSQVSVTENSSQNKLEPRSPTSAPERLLGDMQRASSSPLLYEQSPTRETSHVSIIENSSKDKVGPGSPTGAPGDQQVDVQRASSSQLSEGQTQTRELNQLSTIQNTGRKQDKVLLQIPLEQTPERIVAQQQEVERQVKGLRIEQTTKNAGSENSVGQRTQNALLGKVDRSGGQQRIAAEQGSSQVTATESSILQREVGPTGSLSGATMSDVSNLGQVNQRGAEIGQQRMGDATQFKVPSQQLSVGTEVEMLNRGLLKEGENRNIVQSETTQVKVTESSNRLHGVGDRGSIGAGTSEVSNFEQAHPLDKANGQLPIRGNTQSKLQLQQFSGGSGATSFSRDLLSEGQTNIVAQQRSSQVKLHEYPSGLGEMTQKEAIRAGSLNELPSVRQARQGGRTTGQLRIGENAQSKVLFEKFSAGDCDLLIGGQQIIPQQGHSQVKGTEYPINLGETAKTGRIRAGATREDLSLRRTSLDSRTTGLLRTSERTPSKVSLQQISGGRGAASFSRNLLGGQKQVIGERQSSQLKFPEYPSGLGESGQRGTFGAGTLSEVSNLAQASRSASSTRQLRIGERAQSKVSLQQISGGRDAASFSRDLLGGKKQVMGERQSSQVKFPEYPSGLGESGHRGTFGAGTLTEVSNMAKASGSASLTGQLQIGENAQTKFSKQHVLVKIRKQFKKGMQRRLQDTSWIRKRTQGFKTPAMGQLRMGDSSQPKITMGKFSAGSNARVFGGGLDNNIRKVVQVTTSQNRANSFMGGPSGRVIVRIKTVRKSFSDQSPIETAQGLGRLRIVVHKKTLGHNSDSSILLPGGSNMGETIFLNGPGSNSGTSRVLLTQHGGIQRGSKQGGRWWKVKVYRYRVQKGGKTITGHNTITTLHSKPTVVKRQWSWSTEGSSSGFPALTTALGGLPFGGTALGGGFSTSHGGLSHSQIIVHNSGITSGLQGRAGDLLASVGGLGGIGGVRGVSGSSSHQFSQSITIRRK